MALESGTYISSLNASNPAATDALSQADEHLRLLKATIKATWPNVTGAVTATQADLNTRSAITTNGSVPALASGITAAEVRSLLGIAGEVFSPAILSNGSVPTLATGITAAEVVTLLGVSLLNVYPVGSIYTSVVSTTPATHFGGTWVAIGAGKVLVGIDASDTDFDTVEETGGTKTHTLTLDQIPAHTHTFDAMQDTTESVNRTGGGDLGAPGNTATASAGGGQSHPIVQPYLVVYMWKRTA
jgi:hypothetical protein|tara:strand:+ start:389 stop:1117 length:729 start_codon:yes stop_codon:yes gene_type:complete